MFRNVTHIVSKTHNLGCFDHFTSSEIKLSGQQNHLTFSQTESPASQLKLSHSQSHLPGSQSHSATSQNELDDSQCNLLIMQSKLNWFQNHFAIAQSNLKDVQSHNLHPQNELHLSQSLLFFYIDKVFIPPNYPALPQYYLYSSLSASSFSRYYYSIKQKENIINQIKYSSFQNRQDKIFDSIN